MLNEMTCRKIILVEDKFWHAYFCVAGYLIIQTGADDIRADVLIVANGTIDQVS